MSHQSLANIVYYEGPRSFKRRELNNATNLFRDRSALFHTPPKEIPEKWIGVGILDVWLPVPVPGLIDHLEIWGVRSPRLWVSLLQRATGKLRWTPVPEPYVSFHSYDLVAHGSDYMIKAMLDSLKVSTTGRRDGRTIYYFGAIIDDNDDHLAKLDVQQYLVECTRDVGCRILIRGVDENGDGA